MGSTPPPLSSASVRNILTLLVSKDAYLIAGGAGLERRVTWACHMRARLPAFESVRGGELALLGLHQLRRLNENLPHLLKTLHTAQVAAVAVAAPSIEALGPETTALADQLHLPLILLPPSASLEEIEREVITFVVSFHGEIERKATEVFHQLMQLSVQGVGMQGVCNYLARSCNTWVVVQNAEREIHLQAAPPHIEALPLPTTFNEEVLRQHNLAHIVVPILIRHETIGYLSLIGKDSNFDYLERIILGQVSPILALEFARERERTEVESRYKAEAFMDILQGSYQQADEMLARARLLGYDLNTPQIVVIIEIALSEHDLLANQTHTQWGKRVETELRRTWPTCWTLNESRRVTAFLPSSISDNGAISASESEREHILLTQLERAHARMQQTLSSNSHYSIGIGRVAKSLPAIPQSFRQAQQALEIGRRLFGEGKLHSFARLGTYRILFHLHGQEELTDFYEEMLGPLLDQDTRSNDALITTLDNFFRCNGNLSETARTMHFHRNTLLYRLGRIEELLGRSLEDPELRLSLQIALKIRQMQKL